MTDPGALRFINLDPKETGPAAEVVGRLRDRAVEGRLTTCSHLRPGDPTYWLPCKPGTLRCERCLGGASTAMDRNPVCDRCGAPGADQLGYLKVLPSVVEAAPRVVVSEPIIMVWKACKACAEEHEAQYPELARPDGPPDGPEAA